jgi:integrase
MSVATARTFAAERLKKPATKRWHRVTATEYLSLLAVAPTVKWKVFYALAYTSGARVGELFSLTWNDIDFEKGRLLISDREGTADVPPFHVKDHEARRIPLPAHTIDWLTALHAAGPEGTPYVLLDKERYEHIRSKWHLLQKEGKPWRNRYMINNVLRDFRSHYKRAGIKPVGKLTIHTLRKSCGQNWADRLPMNVVKELLGHSKVDTTLEFYNQVDVQHEEKAASVIQELIGDASKSQKSDAGLTPEPVFGLHGGVK